MKLILIILLPFIFILSCSAQSDQSIDGRTFLISSFLPDGTKAGEEFIYFKNGQIEGSECNKYGYDKPEYSINDEEIVATMVSPSEGFLEWVGKIENPIFMGTALWIKEGQSKILMTFKGEEVTE